MSSQVWEGECLEEMTFLVFFGDISVHASVMIHDLQLF